MRRRSGQSGSIVRKGKRWCVKFYFDVPEGRIRKSISVGLAVGPNRITKAEAARKGTEIVQGFGVNTEAHLAQAQRPAAETFAAKVRWCRKFHKAWTDGKPGPIGTMESQLEKHILPRFATAAIDMVNERTVQEFVADLKRTTFERRRKDGTLMKTYKLSRKTVLNVVGVIKLVVGRKVWKTWEINLGKPKKTKQPYFKQEDFKRLIEAAPKRYRMLFTLLAGTGMRIGEAVALHLEDIDLEGGVITVRRSVWCGQELEPKTENAVREVDVDETLVGLLRAYVGESKRTYLFESRKGTPLTAGNIRNRVLKPLCGKLGIAPGGFHAFRHGRVTVLRKNGTPPDLQRLWIGHSSLRTGDRYSHTDEDLAFRRAAAGQVGLGGIVAAADGDAKTDVDVRANRAKSGEAAEDNAAAVTAQNR